MSIRSQFLIDLVRSQGTTRKLFEGVFVQLFRLSTSHNKITHIKFSQMNDAHQLKVVYNFHYSKQFCIKSQHFHDYADQTWMQIIILGHQVEGEVGHQGCDRSNHGQPQKDS